MDLQILYVIQQHLDSGLMTILDRMKQHAEVTGVELMTGCPRGWGLEVQ